MSFLDWLIYGSCGPNLPDVCKLNPDSCTCQPNIIPVILLALAGLGIFYLIRRSARLYA